MTRKAGAASRPTPEAAPQTEPTVTPVGSSPNGVLGGFQKAYPDWICRGDTVRFKMRKEDEDDQARTGVLNDFGLKQVGWTNDGPVWEQHLIIIGSAGRIFHITDDNLLGKDPQQVPMDGPVTKEQGHGGTSSRS